MTRLGDYPPHRARGVSKHSTNSVPMDARRSLQATLARGQTMYEESNTLSKSKLQNPVAVGGEMDPEEPPEIWR